MNQNPSETKKNITKRKKCDKGTRWVESAQKCMSSEEKESFMIANQKKKNTKTRKNISVAKEDFPVAKKDSPVAKEDSPVAKPENILLQANQKKCPPNYSRYPPKSRNCRLNSILKDLETNRKTRKNTFIPKILSKGEKENTEIDILPNIADGISSDPVIDIEKQDSIKQDSVKEDSVKEDSIKQDSVKQDSIKQDSVKQDSIKEDSLKEDSVKQDSIKENSSVDIDIEEDKIPKSEIYEELDTESAFLYPDLSDPDFSTKIYNKKEFNDYQYDGTIHDIKEQSDKECKAPFEIMPHQQFVKNFLSMETPYNSLLLYHELGTGKTCSAIGITEEMRKYMKQIGNIKKILIVASPNVQENFKSQLFDADKLKEIGRKGSGIWNLNSCVGNDLLKEINPNNHFITKDSIAKKIQAIIRESYDFIGYESLANYIQNVASFAGIQMDKEDKDNEIEKEKEKYQKIDERKLQKVFDNRMIVIDEVHNIIGKDDSESKMSSRMLLKLVKHCRQLRLLFLSGTPMYNSYQEIIWLINIMNLNDQRSTIRVNQVFKEDGSFVEEEIENDIIIKESGKEVLKRKLIGYVSYIRGENPYIFPYRIYPSDFASPKNQIQTYPTKQMNGKTIENPLKYIQVYVNKLGEYQQKGYSLIIQNFLKNIPDFEEKETFGYVVLQEPISALNMIYPSEILNESEKDEDEDKEFEEYKLSYTGKQGFNNIMTYKTQDNPFPLSYDFEYKPSILEKYGRIFHKEHIGKYSGKISNICNIIENSKGIVLIYSKYIEGGLIPMALALEEMGFSRYGESQYTKSLFKTKPTEDIDPLLMKPNPQSGYIARYVMITGQKQYSPNNTADLKLVTDISNKNGEHVRVILISEAGSEGLDFKNIRQVHILDPWYNMNRIEQVIGRAVRTKSHCNLDLKDRNVEIYLHGSIGYLDETEEMVDMYMYRLAEKKALLIGQVTRTLKETAVDCLLNIDQTNFTQENINQTLSLELSTNNKQINYSVGDKPFTNMCDYMENCQYTCSSKNVVKDKSEGDKSEKNKPEGDIKESETYTQYFLQNNYSRIAKRIRQLFREKSIFTFDSFVKEINIIKPFPLEQIYYTISIFLNNKEWIVDKKERKGYLIKRKNTYLFQPLEIKNENASIFERTSFVENKPKFIPIEIPKDPILSVQKNTSSVTSSSKTKNTNLWNSLQKIMDIVLSESSYIKPILQNMHWYHYTKLAYRICIHKHNIPSDICKKYIIYHYLDTLSIEDKLWFLHHFNNSSPFQEQVRNYFQDKMNDSKTYILLYDKSILKNQVFKKDKDNWKIWTIHSTLENWLNSFDYTNELLNLINKMFPKIKGNGKKELHIGCISVFKDNLEFKIKNLLNTRQNPGAACYQTSKKNLIDKVNDLFLFLDKPDSEKYASDPVFTTNIIERPNLCLVYEFLLRYFTEFSSNKWFLNPEESFASQIDSFVASAQIIRGETRYIIKQK
jgi:pentapeptide MXKDX repeat protein